MVDGISEQDLRSLFHHVRVGRTTKYFNGVNETASVIK